MIQRATAPTDIPREIAARITRELHPWRIVLFGSRARGNPHEHSDYDVFVEIDAERAALNRRIECVSRHRSRRNQCASGLEVAQRDWRRTHDVTARLGALRRAVATCRDSATTARF